MAGLGTANRENQGQYVFGLDIGTRSIVGTVGYISNGKFHVVAQRSKEHETRAMLDGQIHDIGKVGESIRIVKEALEDDLNRTLTDVCIAAAGRVLRTVTTYVEQTFESETVITDEEIYALSTAGIEQAYAEFQKTNDTDMKFYCVGYTPMRYYMNGYQIGNLEGHKAKTIAADLIATFLPDDVVDGLYKAVEIADLHVANLTLEPIAAIQVAIPEKYRMLNMALVDVGAGTSDICITKDGTITAYGMIPTAGDSLTDIIVQHCLVDFDTAEHIKRSAGQTAPIEYEDIMGLPQTIDPKEVLEILSAAVRDMTQKVADSIRELNGDKPVSAVFVVGGGGMIPGYTDALAQELGIVKERVAIRGQEVMRDIVFELEDAQKTSLMVTPIGICLSYYEQSNNFIFVEFNGDRLKLYDNGRLTVADAAMQGKLTNEDLFPKRGKALTYTLNGKPHMVRAELGEPAVITIDGDPADLHTQIHSGNRIEMTPSTEGAAASQELGKLSEMAEVLHIYVNGSRIDLPRTAEVNGVLQNEFYQIQDGDDIRVRNYVTVKEAAEFLDVPLGGDIRVNDSPAQPDNRLYENFTVSWDLNTEGSFTNLPEDDGTYEEIKEAKRAEQQAQAVAEAEAALAQALNGMTPDAQGQAGETQTAESGEPAGGTDAAAGGSGDAAQAEGTQAPQDAAPKVIHDLSVMVNDAPVTLHGKVSYVYVDVFNAIDFDLNDARGRIIVTELNGHPASYMEELQSGDVIRIYWKDPPTIQNSSQSL